MKRGIKILLFSDAWANLALGVIGPIYAIFVEKIGGDILDASWAYFVYMLASGLVMLLLSKWEDRMKHKEKFVILGYSFLTLGCFSYLFVHNQLTLLITQVIVGVSLAFLIPAFDAVYSNYVDRKEEAFDWGAWESMAYIVKAFAAIIGGYIASLFGFRLLFFSMFIFSLIATIISINLLRKKKYLGFDC